MDKKTLRRAMIKKIQNLTAVDRSIIEKNLMKNLLENATWGESETIGITISQGIEWNTEAIIEEGWKLGKRICVPKCLPDERKLIFYQIEDFNQLEVGYYGLMEPNVEETMEVGKGQMDLIIVPGLVFDQNRYRIGFGGGYYDRYLANFPNQTVSLAWSNQVISSIPINRYDIPVDQIITEMGDQNGYSKYR